MQISMVIHNSTPKIEVSSSEQSPLQIPPSSETFRDNINLTTNNNLESINNPHSTTRNSAIMAGPTISSSTFRTLAIAFPVFALIAGYVAATQPSGSGWTFFSWHPFLMTTGFVGMAGVASVTKKLGGYRNTKLHGIIASLGLFMTFGGLYVIYENKERHGKSHITTSHAVAGVITISGAIMVMLAGGIFLHPDFGVDKTNQTIRFAHKWFSRLVILLAWITCFMGLSERTSDIYVKVLFALPLCIMAPFTLL